MHFFFSDENITGEEDYEEDDDNRITVIQIEGQEKDKKDSGSESNYSSGSPIPPPPINSNNPHHQETKLEQNHSNTLPFVRPNRRELPRIVTNGTLGRGPPNSTISNPQTFPTKTRRLPDRSHFQNSIQNNNNAQQDSSSSSSSNRYFHSQTHQQQRMYRSNLPRPAPIHHFGPGRVPLPPVPELERSDHERESMSPTPSSSAPSPRSGSVASGSGGGNGGHAYRPLPSPLTTPIQPAIGRVQAKPRRHGHGGGGGGLLRQQEQKTLSPSRIPRASSNERDYTPPQHQLQQQPKMEMEKQQQQGGKQVVDERLRVLLSLLETGKENADNGREDTLQYLSQLESVARRLKDQLLQDAVVAPTHGGPTQQVT